MFNDSRERESGWKRYMKVLLIVVVLIVAVIAAGWLSVQFFDGGASISIDAEKARSDTSQALESVGEAIRDPIEGDGRTPEPAPQ